VIFGNSCTRFDRTKIFKVVFCLFHQQWVLAMCYCSLVHLVQIQLSIMLTMRKMMLTTWLPRPRPRSLLHHPHRRHHS
jgi:hypothetical protein